MYLSGKLEIDPSQVTEIKKLKSSSFFSKFLDVLTFGQSSEKLETETFTAVTILEKIYLGLRSINVENIIRLSVDNYDFYFDEHGKEDDLEEAVLAFTSKVDPIESQLFDSIYLVMEHVEDSLVYLIEIKINRKHKVGEYPITIIVNAVAEDFKKQPEDDIVQLRVKLEPLFNNQDIYDRFINTQKSKFNKFISKLELTVKKFIEVDDILVSSNIQIIRPKQKIDRNASVKHHKFSKPVYYGYYGFDDHFFYAWIWAELMFENNLFAHDFYLVDELGHEILYIGDDGFNAGDNAILNPDVPFEPISNADVEYYSDSEYSDELAEKGVNFDDGDNSTSGNDDSDDDFD